MDAWGGGWTWSWVDGGAALRMMGTVENEGQSADDVFDILQETVR
jgi:hypothetical protein